MSKIGYDLGYPPEPTLRTPDSRLILPFCLLGLEFEFEKVTRNPPTNEQWALYWQAKRDNSLHDAGMEYVFRRPYFGADVIAALEGLLAFARSSRFATSIRTGLHVHVDVRDMEMQEFVNFCALYALFERAIYRYIGDNRDENVFCLPWYKAHGTVLKINNIVRATPDELKNSSAILRDEKYAGLNLDCLARFGSAEFRHAMTTMDVGRVLDWVNITLRFKQAAMSLGMNPKQYLTFINNNNGARSFGERVFQDQFPLLNHEGFEREVLEEGVPVMLDIVADAQAVWSTAWGSSQKGCFEKWNGAKPKKGSKSDGVNLPSYVDTVNIPEGNRMTFNPSVVDFWRGIAETSTPPPRPPPTPVRRRRFTTTTTTTLFTTPPPPESENG